MLSTREYMLRLERELMIGSGRWVADFIESFWPYEANGVVFDLFLHGMMRPKGYVLSRFLARFAMPDYLAGCYVRTSNPDASGLTSVTKAVRGDMKDRELRWSWLVLPGEEPFTSQARARVERDRIEEVGIALVDLSSGKIVTSPSYPGRRMGRFINCFR